MTRPPGPTAGNAPRRLAVRVTKDAQRQLRGGHPWLFDASITAVTPAAGAPEPAAGDLAVVFDDRRRFLAIGLWDPASPIRVKVLHQGAPTPIDACFWRSRLAAARDRRATLAADATTTGYRLVHGENDGLPGLVLDRYADVFVAKLYSEAWLAHLDGLMSAITDVWAPEALVLRLSRATTGAAGAAGLHEGAALIGAAPTAPVPFLENGLRFEADVVHGQKTGFFLDQRDNRARARRWCEAHSGARVLDVFCCSGGFSVNAAAGGAAVVHSVDIAPAAIASARHNMALNRDRPAVRTARHETTTGDAMEVMARLADRGARFDLVVVDPPSFASRQSQVDGALRAYGRLTTLALALLRPGGILAQFSCSSRVTAEQFAAAVHRAASTAGAHLVDERRFGHGLDHPIGFPEGAYLNAVFVEVLFAETRSA